MRICLGRGRAGMWRNANFLWRGIALSHDMRVKCPKPALNCNFEASDATLSHEMRVKTAKTGKLRFQRQMRL